MKHSRVAVLLVFLSVVLASLLGAAESVGTVNAGADAAGVGGAVEGTWGGLECTLCEVCGDRGCCVDFSQSGGACDGLEVRMIFLVDNPPLVQNHAYDIDTSCVGGALDTQIGFCSPTPCTPVQVPCNDTTCTFAQTGEIQVKSIPGPFTALSVLESRGAILLAVGLALLAVFVIVRRGL